MAYCTTCGRELPENVNFCPICGAKVEITETSRASVISEASETPEASNISEASETPEASEISEASEKSEVPEASETVEASETSEQVAAVVAPFETTSQQNGPDMAYRVIDDTPTEGDGKATASLVLGIISVAFWFLGFTAIVSVVCGIIGLVCASKSKALGCDNGKRKAGFVLSLVGLIVGAIVILIVFMGAGLLVAML